MRKKSGVRSQESEWGLAALSLAVMMAITAAAADKKGLPNQAGNDDIELAGTVLVDRMEIQEVLGADLGAGYAVVRMKATPKAEKPIRISPDDFTLLSRKDGERSPALVASQIAGRGAMVVKPGRQLTGLGTQSNGPIWGGIGTGQPRRMPGNGGSTGNSSVESGTAEASIDKESHAAENPLLAPLKAKGLADAETNKGVEGLLYFAIEGKNKPKDLSLLYKGPGGRLVIDFK
jgi:hypothetical protein